MIFLTTIIKLSEGIQIALITAFGAIASVILTKALAYIVEIKNVAIRLENSLNVLFEKHSSLEKIMNEKHLEFDKRIAANDEEINYLIRNKADKNSINHE